MTEMALKSTFPRTPWNLVFRTCRAVQLAVRAGNCYPRQQGSLRTSRTVQRVPSSARFWYTPQAGLNPRLESTYLNNRRRLSRSLRAFTVVRTELAPCLNFTRTWALTWLRAGERRLGYAPVDRLSLQWRMDMTSRDADCQRGLGMPCSVQGAYSSRQLLGSAP
ncbi:hypothetical protein BDZ89DRAFT_1075341 [Hymenopellis radicata]|nr:hypothetical protein BDZ89DRAFT_1075338 [Hymenopellis radicata]KAF9016742.1 hypothetical protein BDZ89DRAFT_1075341 [Hymenopellis radicata]